MANLAGGMKPRPFDPRDRTPEALGRFCTGPSKGCAKAEKLRKPAMSPAKGASLAMNLAESARQSKKEVVAPIDESSPSSPMPEARRLGGSANAWAARRQRRKSRCRWQ